MQLFTVNMPPAGITGKQDNLSKKRRGKETIMNQFEMKQSAYQSQLKSRALQVLIYLIDRSDKEQTCFPAVPTISRDLHISKIGRAYV